MMVRLCVLPDGIARILISESFLLKLEPSPELAAIMLF